MGFAKVFDTDCCRPDDYGGRHGADQPHQERRHAAADHIVLARVDRLFETFHPEFIPNLSTCKSPHEMMGAVVKTFYAEKYGIPAKDIRVVSVMPCTAKKSEADRAELAASGYPDVDAVITTRELARMIKESGIDFVVNLQDEPFDRLLSDSTGAAVIFGATGGVMEAALRTAYEVLTGETLKNLDFHDVRGIAGIKEAEITIGDLKLNVAVANGTANADKLLARVKSGEKAYHFIEIMGCPGGCVTGGGQPIVSAQDRMLNDPKRVRAQALYQADAEMPLRKSHENLEVQLYKDFLGEPNSYKAHQLLHTHYRSRCIKSNKQHGMTGCGQQMPQPVSS